ncbi:MAG: hypothetical protein M1833_003146 [Piccolia ochrophora]|nr:MAG: hypothetical protein M1833_003146 [Piccolia ochrophora]
MSPRTTTRSSVQRDSPTGLTGRQPTQEQKFPKSFNSPRAIQRLKQRMSSIGYVKSALAEEASVLPPSADEEVHDDANDDWNPTGFGDDEEDMRDHYSDHQAAPQSSSTVLVRYGRQQREKNKENVSDRRDEPTTEANRRFFNETQDGAERVEWDDDDEDNVKSQHQAPQMSPRRNKRARDEDDDEVSDVSDDSGFQEDRRPVNVNRREEARVPARKVRIRGSQSQPLRSSSPGEQLRRDASASALQRVSSPARNSRNNSQQGSSARPDADAIDYTQVNAIAKREVALRGPPKVQIRRPWSKEACKSLIDHIEMCGTSWAEIERKRDPLLAGRDQVGLKDKARNMKVDFLKSRLPLPVNFENVRLNRKQIETLHSLNIHYDQGGD